MKTCGIDLGTTNSCIVVVGDGGNTVIRDDQDSPIVPSVVYVGRDGAPVIGLAAKNRMGERNGPVATIKRKMGSTETVTLGDKACTPVDVSAMILTFLRELGERKIGDRIDRAVVTVPAYFNHIQRQHTDEAARRAGFREVITLLEPVAAALAYSLESDRERLRVFVYDLGGGTFDATVLEKDPYGGLTVLSFGGDPHLGGDDVDARLARLILGRLVDLGFALELDLGRPDDFSRFQRLKFYAEAAKKALTDAESTQLTRQGLFEDQKGAIVDLDTTITREDLEGCCRDLIQRTIDASLATLDKEGRAIPLDSIDEIIMVGGMSRMPLVQRMLAEAFGRPAKVVDPDLIVGLGAAVKAAEVFADQDVAASGLRLELRYDRRTDQDRVRIAGTFDRPLRGHTAFLLGGRHELERSIDGSDRFSFDGVPLVSDRTNVFTVSIEDAEEQPVIQREIRIVHGSGVAPILVSPGSVVTKAIGIGTLDGAHVLFPENTALPHTASHAFETADQSGRIVAPILEGDREVERVEIRDIPRDLPIGTPVLLEVAIHADYHIDATATVPDLKRRVSIDFDITAVDTAKVTPAYVRERLAAIETKARTAVAQCPSGEAVRVFEFRFGMIKEEIGVELQEPEPKPAKLHEKLGSLELLVRALPGPAAIIDLKPTHEEFSERLQAVVTRAIETDHPKLAECQPRIDEIRARARAAWTGKDPIAWRRVNEQVDAIAMVLRPEMPPEERAMGMAAWIVLQQVPEMRTAADGRFAADIDAIEAQANRLFALVKLGTVPPQEAMSDLVGLYHRDVVPLRRRLGLETADEPSTTTTVPAGEGILRAAKRL